MKYELSLTYNDFLKRKDTWIAFMLSSLILFYVVKLLTIANVGFHNTIYRFTYPQHFNEAILGSFFVDNMVILALGLTVICLILNHRTYAIAASGTIFVASLVSGMQGIFLAEAFALATVPAIITFAMIDRTNKKLIRTHIPFYTLAITTTAVILIFELLALARWISYPFLPSKIYGDWSWGAAKLESKLFYIFGLLSPAVMLLMVHAFLVKSSLKDIRAYLESKFLKNRNDFVEPVGKLSSSSIAYESRKVFFKGSAYRWVLAASFALAIIFSIYPYLPAVNPDFRQVSVDVGYYVNWVGQVQKSDEGSLLSRAFVDVNNGDRPLSLLFIMALQSVTGLSSQIVVRFLPVVLGPMLVASVYYFVKYGSNNRNIAALSALLTVVSFHFVVGIYAGFFANWLALVTSYLALLFLFKAWEKPSKLNYTIFLALTTLTLFIHVYTWSYLVASIAVFLAISYFINRKSSDARIKHGKMIALAVLAAIIAANVALDVVKTNYLGAAGGLERDLEIAESKAGFDQFLLRWNNLAFTFSTYVGGYFTNAAILILALIWVFKARYDNTFDRILLSAIFVGSLPIIFGDHVMQTRIFYNMPIHIPAAIMLYSVVNNFRTHPILGSVFFIAVIAHFLTYALRSMANLYIVFP